MKLVTLPNPILRVKSTNVSGIDGELKKNIHLMIDLMYKNKGIGLSAVQVGIPQRFFIVDISYKNIRGSSFENKGGFIEQDQDIKYPLIVINPKIKNLSESKITLKEGCLSIPDVFVDVQRSEKLELEFLDLNMKKSNILCKNLLARVVQHEYDHLNGRLIIDHLSYIKRNRIFGKFSKNLKKNSS